MDKLLYAPGDGPVETWGLLYRLDPRSKLLFVVLLSLLLALQPAPAATLAALIGLHALAALSRATRLRLLAFWKALWPLVAAIVLLASLRWQAGVALLRVGPVAITAGSAWLALGLGARITALSLGFSLLLWTTEPGDTVAGLVRLGLPFEVGFPIVMALQYVVTFRRSYFQILEAQQSRGLVLPRGNPIRAARTYLPVVVPLIITALRSADSLALALQSRGFDGAQRRTTRRVLRMRAVDWLFLGATCAVFAAIAVGQRFLVRGHALG